LSLTGCSGIGPLCTVMQDGGELTANCGGLAYAGLVTEDGNVTLTAAPETTNDGAVVTRICEGELSNRGQFTAECTVVTSVDDVETSETCELESDPVLQPSV